MASVVYFVGSDLPDLDVTWQDSERNVIDFSLGYAFVVKIAAAGSSTALVTKISGITGDSSAPNVTVAWSTTGELNDLSPGRYMLQITATRSADGKQRIMALPMDVRQAIS